VRFRLGFFRLAHKTAAEICSFERVNLPLTAAPIKPFRNENFRRFAQKIRA
jgi:hypothetical protein